MARNTRAQRRARRAQQTSSAQPATQEQPKAVQRARARQAAVRPSQQPSKTQTGRRRNAAGGSKRFVAESWGELKKVEWPGQSQLIQGVAVVLIACLIVGVFLYTADLVFKRLVQDVLLR